MSSSVQSADSDAGVSCVLDVYPEDTLDYLEEAVSAGHHFSYAIPYVAGQTIKKQLCLIQVIGYEYIDRRVWGSLYACIADSGRKVAKEPRRLWSSARRLFSVCLFGPLKVCDGDSYRKENPTVPVFSPPLRRPFVALAERLYLSLRCSALNHAANGWANPNPAVVAKGVATVDELSGRSYMICFRVGAVRFRYLECEFGDPRECLLERNLLLWQEVGGFSEHV